MYMSQSKENQPIVLNKPLTIEELNYQKSFQDILLQPNTSETAKLEHFKKFEQWLDKFDKKKKEEVLTQLTSTLSKTEPETLWPLLELWLKYAELQPDPSSTFNFMLKQNIGVRNELFYTKWGDFFEQRKNFKLVEEIYRLGQERIGSGEWETKIQKAQSLKDSEKPEVKRQFGIVLSQTKKDSSNRLKRNVMLSEFTPDETILPNIDEISRKESLNLETVNSCNQEIPIQQPSTPLSERESKPSQDTLLNDFKVPDYPTITPPEESIVEENGDFKIFEDPEGTTDKCTDTTNVTPQKPSPSGKDYTLLDNQENKPPEGLTLPRQSSGDNIESQRVFRPLYYTVTTLDPSEGNNC